MSREEQLALAYRKIAGANHYMVGLVYQPTLDEMNAAEQILIGAENGNPIISRALDLLQQDIRNAYRQRGLETKLGGLRKGEG